MATGVFWKTVEEEEKEVFFRSIKCYLINAGLKCLRDIVQQSTEMGESVRAS